MSGDASGSAGTGGRPSILTDDGPKGPITNKRTAFLLALQGGNDLRTAARGSGLGYSSVMRVLQRAKRAAARDRAYRAHRRAFRAVKRPTKKQRKEFESATATHQQQRTADRPYREFRDQVLTAMEKAELLLVARWHGASKKDWRAAQAMLRARNPEKWARDLILQAELRRPRDEEPAYRDLPQMVVGHQAAPHEGTADDLVDGDDEDDEA